MVMTRRLYEPHPRRATLWLSMLFHIVLLYSSVITANPATNNNNNNNNNNSNHQRPGYRWFCDLQREPIVDLVWSSQDHSFHIYDDDNPNQWTTTVAAAAVNREDNVLPSNRKLLLKKDPTTTFLRGAHQDHSFHFGEMALSTTTTASTTTGTTSASRQTLEQPDVPSNNHNNNNNNNNNTTVTMMKARRCSCYNPKATMRHLDFYCPAPRTHCGIGGDAYDFNTSFVPGCLDLKRQQNFARNVWPVITVWYLVVFLCISCTRPGRHAMGYCLDACWPRWNRWAVSRIMRHDPAHANRIILRRQQQEQVRQLQRYRITTTTTGTSWAASANTTATYDIFDTNNNNNNNRMTFLSGAGFEATLRISTDNHHHPTTAASGEEYLLRTKIFQSLTLPHKNDTETKDGVKTQDGEDQSVARQRVGVTNDTVADDDNHSCDASNNNTEHGDDHQSRALSLLNTDNNDENNNNHDDDDDDDDGLICCAICHGDIEHGDRVGDLPCQHLMHIDCLKAWIVRRNVCPLCLTENIARPRHNNNDNDDTTEQSLAHLLFPDLVVSGE